MRKQIEGSMAVAEAVKLCRPHVISAYPITPQTHIVEDLAQFVADGELQAEFVNVESEFGAASVCLGASATGARAYTATTSQGLMLMLEVLFNIAGLRLPVVLTCANRALSAPINIWNDQQDSMTARDSGWIQLYAEDNQEALDMHVQAYRIGEQVSLPVMVCMDGYVLTHAFDPVDVPDQDTVDAFLPPYRPKYYLDPQNPLTFGYLGVPEVYTEMRYTLYRAVEKSAPVIEQVAEEFKQAFGRYYGGLIDTYRLEDAEIALVAMGSVLGTMRAVVDELREQGQKVGILKVRAFRPFPREAICRALAGKERVAVLEKAISMGSQGILATEIKEALYEAGQHPRVSTFIVGLGGRDVPISTINRIVEMMEGEPPVLEFPDLKLDLIREEDR